MKEGGVRGAHQGKPGRQKGKSQKPCEIGGPENGRLKFSFIWRPSESTMHSFCVELEGNIFSTKWTFIFFLPGKFLSPYLLTPYQCLSIVVISNPNPNTHMFKLNMFDRNPYQTKLYGPYMAQAWEWYDMIYGAAMKNIWILYGLLLSILNP